MQDLFYLFNAWIHLIAAFIWIGGMLFLGLVAVPAARRMGPQNMALVGAFGKQFLKVAWIAIGMLVVTGFFNLLFRGWSLSQIFTGDIFTGETGRVLAAKIVIAGLIIGLSAVHDFKLGPRVAEMSREAGGRPSEELLARRKRLSLLARFNAVLALVIIGLSADILR